MTLLLSPSPIPTTTRQVFDPALERLILDALEAYGWTHLAFDRDSLVATLARAYTAGLRAGAQDVQTALYQAGRARTPRLRMEFNLENPLALEALEKHALSLEQRLEPGTRNFMLNAFKNAFSQEGPGSARELTQAIYNGLTSEERGPLSKRRLKGIVDTEMNFVHSAAREEQYRIAGLTKKKWEAVDSVACPICLRNQARGAVPLAFAGYESVYGPVSHPPGHSGRCHCRLSISLDEIESIASDVQYWDGGEDVVVEPVLRSRRHLPGQHDQDKHAGAIKKQPVSMFHGTSEQAASAIRKEGIKPGGGAGGDAWAVNEGWLTQEVLVGSRKASVFLTSDHSLAKMYADRAASVTGGNPVILTVNVPASKMTQFKQDEKDTRGLRIEGVIPASWVK